MPTLYFSWSSGLLARTFHGTGVGDVDFCSGGIGLFDGTLDTPGRAGQLAVGLVRRALFVVEENGEASKRGWEVDRSSLEDGPSMVAERQSGGTCEN